MSSSLFNKAKFYAPCIANICHLQHPFNPYISIYMKNKKKIIKKNLLKCMLQNNLMRILALADLSHQRERCLFSLPISKQAKTYLSLHSCECTL